MEGIILAQKKIAGIFFLLKIGLTKKKSQNSDFFYSSSIIILKYVKNIKSEKNIWHNYNLHILIFDILVLAKNNSFVH